MRRTLHVTLSALALLLVAVSFPPVYAQDAASELLARVNTLRASLGLPAYRWNNTLAAAAANQARWMADNNQVSHTQPDGSTPRSRARAAGYPSQLVSENIYMGGMASVDSAWNFWVNSAVHYAGLTNARYDEVGIASATGAGGRAYVMVFGTSSGSWDAPAVQRPSSGSRPNAAPPPLPIVGVDNVGNIMYEIQPGDDLGTIALLFGYSWGDIPGIMDLNSLTQDDIRRLRIGSVLLVPPKSGTYTPTPEPTRDPSIPTETPTPTPTLTPTVTPTPTDLPPAVFVMPTATPTRELIVRTLEPVVAMAATPSLQEVTVNDLESPASGLPIWLIAAVTAQVGIIIGAAVQYFRRR
ncbi:CAP domain-containing protein [Aggregatilineales bacterium SYSU G02658]